MKLRTESWRMSVLKVCGALTLVAVGFLQPAMAEDLTPEAAAAKVKALSYMTSEVVWEGPESSPKPIAGSKIALISCCQAAEGAARPARAMMDFGAKMGWEMTLFDGRGDPQEQNKAVNAAVDADFDGIITLFVDTPVIAEGVQRALAADIQFLTLGGLKNTPDTIPDVSWDYADSGAGLAHYMIWKSNGNVNAFMMLNTDLYAVRNGHFPGTYDILTDPELCPDCKVTVKEWALANLDSAPIAMSSAALQADPEINWLWCFDPCTSRAVRSLAAAGYTTEDVRAVGFDCNAENLELIANDVIQVVCVADPREWLALATLDNMNRMLHGEPTVDQPIPLRVFDATNIAQMSAEEKSSGWQGAYDFRSKYLELWGVEE